MIQRIQTIFLAIASGSIFSLFAPPMAMVQVDGEHSAKGTALADGALNIQDDMLLMGAAGLCGLIFLISIFFFNNRKQQISATYSAIGVCVVLIALAAFTFYQSFSTLGGMVSILPSIGGIMPIVAIILGFLAVKNIRKDDKIVKSMDRLR